MVRLRPRTTALRPKAILRPSSMAHPKDSTATLRLRIPRSLPTAMERRPPASTAVISRRLRLSKDTATDSPPRLLRNMGSTATVRSDTQVTNQHHLHLRSKPKPLAMARLRVTLSNTPTVPVVAKPCLSESTTSVSAVSCVDVSMT